MRSRLHAVTGQHPSELSTLLDRAEALAGELPRGKVLDAIARTARLDALLRARYSTLLASSRPETVQPDPEVSRYLDTPKTARYLGVSRSTVVRLTKAGTLPCTRPSDAVVRYDRQDLDGYMERRKSR